MRKPADNLSLPLFVPADRPERFIKAINAEPDAVFIDLEDAVAPENKVTARNGLIARLAELPSEVPLAIRINAVGTPWHEDDLALAARLAIAAVVLPKSEKAEDVIRVAERSGHAVIALIESAAGLANVREVAAVSARLAFGSIDYAADLMMAHTQQSLLAARSEIVLASRLADLPSPIDGVTTSIQDEAALLSDCAHATELGFGGKLLIHPMQIAIARHGFMPSQEECAWAQRVLQAATNGAAALRIDGHMVDAPVIMRAQQIALRAGKDLGIKN